MIKKDTWNDFNILKFINSRFVTQDVIYPGKCFMCTWEKGEIHYFGVKCPLDISWVKLAQCRIKAYISLLILCLDDLPNGVSCVLMTHYYCVLIFSPGENERYTHLKEEFQRIARRDKKAFLSDQCNEKEKKNRMGKTREYSRKLEKPREIFMQRWAQ